MSTYIQHRLLNTQTKLLNVIYQEWAIIIFISSSIHMQPCSLPMVQTKKPFRIALAIPKRNLQQIHIIMLLRLPDKRHSRFSKIIYLYFKNILPHVPKNMGQNWGKHLFSVFFTKRKSPGNGLFPRLYNRGRRT